MCLLSLSSRNNLVVVELAYFETLRIFVCGQWEYRESRSTFDSYECSSDALEMDPTHLKTRQGHLLINVSFPSQESTTEGSNIAIYTEKMECTPNP